MDSRKSFAFMVARESQRPPLALAHHDHGPAFARAVDAKATINAIRLAILGLYITTEESAVDFDLAAQYAVLHFSAHRLAQLVC